LTCRGCVDEDRGLFEIDFFAVGQGGKHGDAIGIRFMRAETGSYAHVIIDAGFQQNGQDFVDYIKRWYATSAIDLAIVTHPDGDHIGGMGDVIREFDVAELWIHRLRDRGGGDLRAADVVDELIELAEDNGTTVVEPFAGTEAFSGALRILGPDETWYAQMVQDQLAEAEERAAPKAASRFLEGARVRAQKLVAALPIEIPFDDAGGTNPRNNSSAVTLLEVDQRRSLFTADAGVPALERALDWIESQGGNATSPNFVQMAHHGSRHNASSAFLDRLLGAKTDDGRGTAYVNVAAEAVKHPSPRVANAFARRGYPVYQTHGEAKWHHQGTPDREGFTTATPLGPLDESEED
jgi:beta-lactamase superfamily II metal-dependent hydrolase